MIICDPRPRTILTLTTTCRMALPNLPIEIWDYVLDLIAADHAYHVVYTTSRGAYVPTPFHACCMTCRSWVPKSRYHLYSLVCLRDQDTSRRFTRSLDTNPANRIFVRTLRLGYSTMINSTVFFHDSTQWIHATLLSLAPRLQKLQEIYAFGLNLSEVHPHFHLCMRLLRGLRSLYLDCLHASASQLLRVLHHLNHLTSLDMMWMSGKVNTLVGAVPPRKLALTKLTMYGLDENGVADFVSLLSQSWSFPSLSRVDFFFTTGPASDEVIAAVGLLVRSCTA